MVKVAAPQTVAVKSERRNLEAMRSPHEQSNTRRGRKNKELRSGHSRAYRKALRLSQQIGFLFILALPIASIAWTVTHEEVVREFRDYCVAESKVCRRVYERKFFYLFTCEYCFSHYVAAAFLIVTRYQLLYPDWRGYLIAEFALVWVANVYMGLFGRIKLDIRKERAEITAEETLLGNK